MKKYFLILFLQLFFLSFHVRSQTLTPHSDTCKWEMPRFPGGINAVQKFILDSLHVPDSAILDKVNGTAIISCVIDTDGAVTNIKVFQSLQADLDNEALRVIGLLPKWTPATKECKNVRVLLSIPIRVEFDKNKYKVLKNKLKKKRNK